MFAEGIGITAIGKLILGGTCLSVGFWAGKKVTNYVDYQIAMRSSEVKEFIRLHKKAQEKEEEVATIIVGEK